MLKKYDLILYHALLESVYGEHGIEQAILNNKRKYLNKIKPLFNQSFLDEDKKLERLISNYRKSQVDVFFFQEFSQALLQKVEDSGEYFVVTDEPEDENQPRDTLIIVRKSRFHGKKPENTLKMLSKMNLKEQAASLPRTSIMFIDRFVLINLHFSSKQEPNQEQVKFLGTFLKSIKQAYPDYQIIAGGDINSYLDPEAHPDLQFYYSMFP